MREPKLCAKCEIAYAECPQCACCLKCCRCEACQPKIGILNNTLPQFMEKLYAALEEEDPKIILEHAVKHILRTHMGRAWTLTVADQEAIALLQRLANRPSHGPYWS